MKKTDETTISFVGAGRDDDAEKATEHLALMIAWSTAEPHRVGEVALLPRGTDATLGRGEGDGGARVSFVRQRPGLDEPGGPLGGAGLSRDQLRIVAHDDTIDVELLGKKSLAFRGVEVDRCKLRPGDVMLVRQQLVLLCVRRRSRLPARRTFPFESFGRFGEPDALGMIGESEVAWRLREDLAFAAQSGEHVLLLGESGTGKELAASAVHRLSRRRAHPFVARNAATLPPGLIDAELFGHAKNYPNAGMQDRAGIVGEANGGVLFLDEIAELPQELQSHLLRVLDAKGEYQRLGDTTSRRSDFVLVGATNRGEAALKHDLVARFSLQVALPPLRSRQADIPLFIRHLLHRAMTKSPALVERFFTTDGASRHPRVDPELVVDLLSRSFPANVRELESVLWRSIAASTGDTITFPADAPPPDREPVEEVNADQIRTALRDHGGSMTKVAAALGLPSRYALYRLMKRYEIER